MARRPGVELKGSITSSILALASQIDGAVDSPPKTETKSSLSEWLLGSEVAGSQSATEGGIDSEQEDDQS